MSDADAPDPFDPFDDELRRRFAGGSPAGADPDVVLEAMRPQMQRARTRRRASFASALGGVAVVVVVLLFAFGGGGGGTGSVRTPPASRGPVSTVPPATTTAPAGGSATPDSVPDTVDDHGDDSTSATTPTTPADSVPEATPTTGGSQLVPAGQDATYGSDGGSIVVRLAGGVVSLVSNTPAPGYSPQVHDNGPTRVEVRFDNGQTEWRIRVDVENGQLVPEITH